MLFSPADYAEARPYDLLTAAARGLIAFDKRLFRALTADPKRTRPDLERFSREDRSRDRVDTSLEVMSLFSVIPSPEAAAAYLVSELRRLPEDAPEEMLQLAVRLGNGVAEPLLDLFEETGRQNTEVLFVALTAGASGPRVEAALAAVDASDPTEADFLREIRDEQYEDDPKSEPGAYIPETADPDLSVLSWRERSEFLASPSAELRRLAVGFYVGETLSDRRRQQMLSLGATDPDPGVRAFAWEALGMHTDMKPVRDAMLARLKVAGDPGERASLAVALAHHPETPGFSEAIQEAYERPETRHKAIEAMWRCMDRRWAHIPPLHLEDADTDVRRQALVAAGYFQLHSEAPRLARAIADPEVRVEGIIAYALAGPAEESRYGLRQLERRIEELAGGLTEIEEEELRHAIETRHAMSGRGGTAHGANEPGEDTVVLGAKIGRNDPCPCGSGKKYKKCHGA